jgi:hypothetical protein
VRRRLILLTVLVLLAHSLLLGGLSAAISLWQGQLDAAAEPAPALRFVTRTLAPAPAPVAASTPPASPAQHRPPPAPAKVSPAAPAAVAPAGPTVETAPAAAASTVPDESGAAAALPPAPTSSAPAPGNQPESLASAEASPPAGTAPAIPVTPAQPAAGSTVQRPGKLLPPAAVRMLFDGRGEERGFIKYAASAELLWLPVGAEYSARLEISTWGIRMRTWTSKGTLGETGLMPTRFGDKPRGAEQATHFQRDKGIISFSANNPDVPLQAGAQDKLSALLQLSALVAGEPERYRSGTRISFQAADAHRAESWDFQVGALEPLDLPGGTLSGLKFSKEPTLEFDQRIEVWLAPDQHYLPVRLRITEANGAFADLLWRNTQKPD